MFNCSVVLFASGWRVCRRGRRCWRQWIDVARRSSFLAIFWVEAISLGISLCLFRIHYSDKSFFSVAGYNILGRVMTRMFRRHRFLLLIACWLWVVVAAGRGYRR